MKLRTAALAVIAAATLTLAGCAPAAEVPSEPVPASSEPSAGDLLAEHDLDGLTGKEIVEQLDADPGARPLAVAASVREYEVLVSDGTTEVPVELPADQFRLSIAPYVDTTHECYWHNLGTCQGELAGEDVHVTITAEDGTVLVDEDATTYANGFVGFWVPRDVAGTITVTRGDLTGSVPFATGEGDPTCITTLQLA